MLWPRLGRARLVFVAAALVLAGCANAPLAAQPELTLAVPDTSSTTTTTSTTRPPRTTTTATTTTTEPEPTLPPECSVTPEPLDEPPPSVVAVLEQAASDPAFGSDVTISIWIDGWGEVVAVNPDLALVPASNQKLLVGLAAHHRLDVSSRFRTTVERAGSNLVLRADGDPTFTSAHLEELARQVAAAGVSSADRLFVDVSSYPQAPEASGWLDFHVPRFAGPLSGLMVDDNRWTSDEAFLVSPDIANGHRFAEMLAAAGVSVSGVEVGSVPLGQELAVRESAPINDLVRAMLLNSDNSVADLLLIELGRDDSGVGTLGSGAEVIDDVLLEFCVLPDGTVDDGSGLSRGNVRSAREFQEILRLARDTPAGDQLRAQLPVGGVSGTLANRFGADSGRVAAKTGTILDGRSLSGYATTDSGREVVFSIVVNGEREVAQGSLAAIDRLVTSVLRT